jgi:hypothetical protein
VTTTDQLEQARPDLEALLTDVLTGVLGDQACPVPEDVDGAPVDGARVYAVARLAIHDKAGDVCHGVEVALGPVLARHLAARMLRIETPTPDDLLDAVGELGNIAAGSVKSLLFTSARLSLPEAEFVTAGRHADGPPHLGPATTVRVRLLGEPGGEVVELSLIPHVPAEAVAWPPAARPDVLEPQS